MEDWRGQAGKPQRGMSASVNLSMHKNSGLSSKRKKRAAVGRMEEIEQMWVEFAPE